MKWACVSGAVSNDRKTANFPTLTLRTLKQNAPVPQTHLFQTRQHEKMDGINSNI